MEDLRIIKRKSNCDACKADNNNVPSKCDLGYNRSGDWYSGFLVWAPVEPCPRPLTVNGYYYCLESKEFNKKFNKPI